MLIEIHVLQNFAPSNLNRDDTGSPKDCEFGGYRRARISSQCLKRSVRWIPAVQQVAEATFAHRSNMHARQIAELLANDQQDSRPFEEAYNVGRYMFQKMGFKEKKERLTVMLLLGGDEIKTLAKAAADNWDTLAPLSNESLLWDRLADQLTSYLTDLGEDAEMCGRLVANHKAGSAHASALQQWLDMPATEWDVALAAVRQMPAEFLEELRQKFTTADNTAEEPGDEEEYVPKPAAALFKSTKKNKDVVDKLKKIEIKTERGRDASPDSEGKKQLTRRLNAIFKPLKRLTTKAVNVAMFGRMIAEIKDGAMTVDAACQVAHAISTHRVAMESDYFTAVEELKELANQQGVGQDAGAGMIGTVEFNSACFYRYANLDMGQLKKNLQGDASLAKNTVAAFLKAFIHAIPTGKQNSFAAHNPPSLVFAIVRDGPPVSLANAFVKPIAPRNGDSLIEKSIEALDAYYGRFLGMYGDGGLKKSAVCQMDEVPLKHLKAPVASVEELIDTVIKAAFDGRGEA
ncbi:MAG: type I-E CRISPR-associated protein Cas7/Cse4/CasC [Gemmataceae bacterium]